jgi:hypothetical protein
MNAGRTLAGSFLNEMEKLASSFKLPASSLGIVSERT